MNQPAVTNASLRDFLKKIEKDLNIEGIKKSNVIDVSLKNTDPEIDASE